MSIRNVAKPMFTTTNDEQKPIRITPVGKMQQKPGSQSSTPPRPLPLTTIKRPPFHTLNRPESLQYSRASNPIRDISCTISEFSEGEDNGDCIDSKDPRFVFAGEMKESHIGKKPERIISRIHSLTMSEIGEFERAYHSQRKPSPIDTENDAEVTKIMAGKVATNGFRAAYNANSTEIDHQESVPLGLCRLLVGEPQQKINLCSHFK